MSDSHIIQQGLDGVRAELGSGLALRRVPDGCCQIRKNRFRAAGGSAAGGRGKWGSLPVLGIRSSVTVLPHSRPGCCFNEAVRLAGDRP